MRRNAVDPLVVVARRPLLQRVADWIEAHAWLAIAGFSALYAVATAALAIRSPLWNDELFTYYFTRVPSLSDLWRALESGAEQTPPLSYLLTRASFGVFGVSNLTIRLPEILAVLIFCLCSYVFVARRSNRLYGLLAMLAPTLTVAYYYAFEARSYALVLAFGSLAFLCWQLAADGVRRRLALVGLAVSLAVATSSNYYAILLLVPLLAGDLVRTLERRRMDKAVLAAFAGAVVPLVAFIPLIRSAHSYSAHFWGHPTWKSPTNFFSFLLGTRLTVQLFDRDVAAFTIVCLLLALFVVVPSRTRLPASPRSLGALCFAIAAVPLAGFGMAALLGGITLQKRELALVCLLLGLAAYMVARARSGVALLPGPPAHEVAALAGFLLLPVAAILLAKLGTNAYVPRYALPAAIGFSILLPLAVYRLEGGRPSAGLLLLGALTLAFVVNVVSELRLQSNIRSGRQDTYRFLEERASGSLPILLVDSHDYLELSYSPPDNLRPRLFYLADPEASVRAFGSDTAERGLLELRKLAPLRVYDFATYTSRHRRFLVYSRVPRSARSWALSLLRRQGSGVRRIAIEGHRALYEVSL